MTETKLGISSTTNWDGDYLGRKQEGDNLLHFLEQRYENKSLELGFVLAINGDWGSGKTFFIERVSRDAITFKHPTFVFDAWKNDYTKDPLLAFISEFDSGLKEHFKKISLAPEIKNKVREIIKKTWKPALAIIGGALLKHGAGLTVGTIRDLYDDDEDDEDDEDAASSSKDDNGGSKSPSITGGEAFKDAQTQLSEALKKALAEHRTMKESIEQFKIKVSLLVTELSAINEVTLPIFVFVDELDRCRPDYAVELLEGIKHLFGVPGVYFIVSTNISQLTHSVKAIYGEGFDGQTYLKRFFDLQYSLSKPDTTKFCYSLFTTMKLPTRDMVVSGLGGRSTEDGILIGASNSVQLFAYVLERHATTFGLTARDQLQVATIVEAALYNLEGKPVHVFFLMFLAVIYHLDLGIFSKVIAYKGFSTITGYDRLDLSYATGNINLRGNNSAKNSFSLKEIATVYFQNLTLKEMEWYAEKEKINVFDFPTKLPFFSDSNADSGFNEFIKVASYPDIVRRAGAFSRVLPDDRST